MSLLGVHFQVFTDHCTLEYFQSQKDMSCQQVCWSMYLANFDYEITYIRGEDNTAADALSQGLYSPPHCPVRLQTGLWLKIAENDGLTYWTKKKIPQFSSGQSDGLWMEFQKSADHDIYIPP